MKGTHELALEFSRTSNFELGTGIASCLDNTRIQAYFIDELLAEQIRENFEPEEIFTDDQLVKWAGRKTAMLREEKV